MDISPGIAMPSDARQCMLLTDDSRRSGVAVSGDATTSFSGVRLPSLVEMERNGTLLVLQDAQRIVPRRSERGRR